MPALPNKVVRSQAGTYEREHERCRAAIAGLRFQAGAAYFDEIDRQCESLVGRLFAQRLDDLNEGTALTPALFQDIQQDAIEHAYSHLSGLTYMQRFVYEVERCKSAPHDFLKEAAFGLSSSTEGLAFKLFLVEQHRDSPTFGGLIRQLDGRFLSRRQSQFLRLIKNEGDRCRHNRDHTVSREHLNTLCKSALDFVLGLRGLAFETKCPVCRSTHVVRLEEILDARVGADTVRRACGHPVYLRQVTITALLAGGMGALAEDLDEAIQALLGPQTQR